MRKISVLILFLSLIYVPFSHAADSGPKTFHGTGEVTSVDTIYSRVTIQHDAIKDFAGDAESEFFVETPGLLKNIHPLDIVEFEIEESKGDAQIVKISKIGQGTPKEEGIALGEAAQGVFSATGNVVRTVTAPIAPVSEAAGGATEAAGGAVNEAQPRVTSEGVASKTKF